MKGRRHISMAVVMGAAALAAALGIVINTLPDRGVVAPVAPRTETAAAGETSEPRRAEDDKQQIFDSHFQAGVAALRRGHYHRAAEIFELAWRMAPHVPEVHVNLGFAFVGLNEYDRAAAAFNKAIDLRPQQANAYFGLAESLQELGDEHGALGAMRTYVHLTPEDDPFRRRALAAIWELQELVTKVPPADAAPSRAGSDASAPRTQSDPPPPTSTAE